MSKFTGSWCRTCVFKDEDRRRNGDGRKICRRFPPVPVGTPQFPGNVVIHAWPTIADGDWCGEHVKRDDPPA